MVMNIENFKDAWNSQAGENIILPKTINQLKAAGQPLDKIKKNMKHELFSQLLGIILLGIFPQLLKITKELYLLYYALYALMLLVCGYYLVKFFFFFKQVDATVLSSKENLYELYYEIRLKIEMYKSFAYLLAPFSIIFSAILIFGLEKNKLFEKLRNITNMDMLLCFVLFATIIVVVTLITNWWLNHFYGKYVRQIRNILDELREENV
jgi:hypothetical protein